MYCPNCGQEYAGVGCPNCDYQGPSRTIKAQKKITFPDKQSHATIALVFGIISLVSGSIPAAIVAMIMGSRNSYYKSARTGKTLGTVGLVLAILRTVFSVFMYFFWWIPFIMPYISR